RSLQLANDIHSTVRGSKSHGLFQPPPFVGPRSAHWMRPSGTPPRLSVYLSMSLRASALPLFCVQHPLQSLSPQGSNTVTTMVLPVLDFRHRSCRPMVPSGKNAMMLWRLTQSSDFTPEQVWNIPSYMHPLNTMHSSLP